MTVSIEFLNQLMDRLAKAAAANKATHGRRGCLVTLGEADADMVLLAGDLHGNRENFNKIVKAARLDKFPKRHLVLQEVVHGGPTNADGGDTSHMLLEDVADLKVKYPDRFHFILCNHELAQVTEQPIIKAGVSQNQMFFLGAQRAYGLATTRVVEGYRDFVLSCPLAIKLANGVLISHSVPDRKAWAKFDRKLFDRQPTAEDLRIGGSAHAMVWGRDYDMDHVQAFLDAMGATALLTGHEPSLAGFSRPNPRQIVFDASGSACYLCVVPVKRAYTADELAANLHKL